MLKSVYYKGDTSRPFHLEESGDLLLLRIGKGKTPEKVLKSIPGLEQHIGQLNIKARFPDSNTYVYQCISKSKGLRDHIKDLIKKAASPNVVYAGSVFKFSKTGIYQIYTENIFLKFHDAITTPFILSFLEQNHLQIKRPLNTGNNSYFLEAKQSHGRHIFSFCEELLHHEAVELCHPEMVTQLQRVSRNFTMENLLKPQLDKEWWLKRTGVFDAWKYSKGNGTIISIIDDGLEMDNMAFSNRIIHPRDMTDPSGLRFPQHCFGEGHGTSCASIACSADSAAFGVAPMASLMPIRITGLGSVLQSEAIYYAVKNGADVISCSWGPPDGDVFNANDNDFEFPLPDHTRLAFEYAAKNGRKGKGTPIVFAAGNGKELVKYDGYASSEHVIAVTAINHRNQPTIYSDYGPPAYCTFPSGDFEIGPDKKPLNATGIYTAGKAGIASNSADDPYTLFSGTSASCPGVAGIISLMYATDPDLTLQQVKELIRRSCEKISLTAQDEVPEYSEYFGHGLLRADNAVLNTLNAKLKPEHMENKKKKAISLHIGINNVSTSYYGSNVPPLLGCINDMNAMRQLAEKAGYVTNTLSDAQATRENITAKIVALGNDVAENGILLVTYAGHGAPIKNTGTDSADVNDNRDGSDEAWVAYNGFLLDDELFMAFAAIKNRIRVVLVSDSCHSQSMSRFIKTQEGTDVRVRSIDEASVERILRSNNLTANDLRAGLASRNSLTYKVFVKALSACLKDETAKEVGQRGVYTVALQNVYAKLQGKQHVSYRTFVDQISAEIRSYQQPTVENSHNENPAFDAQFPFDINHIELVASAPVIPGTNTVEQPTVVDEKEVKLFYETGQLYIESKVRTKKKKEYLRGAWRNDKPSYERSLRFQSAPSAWDGAYDYLLSNSDEVDFVEPEIVSRMHFTKDSIAGGARDTGSYLGTYPDPETCNAPVPFIWHLDDEHSQLAKANREVFPEIEYGAKNATEKDLVKIAHIDTGYLPHHPALPVNVDLVNAKSFDMGNDVGIDNDAVFALMEQQGHGNATMAILAGNWVDLEVTESNYKGFYGAIPYAKVLPIKISETVALLSGRNFAEAVDYAIAQGCDVITMSMAGLPSKVMAKAVNRAYEAGIVIVSAASNSFSKGAGVLLPKQTLYPAHYDRVIAATGATCNKKPYLNEYHKGMTRAEGGLYMQTCYGPESVLPTTIGAYTPNISWFHKMRSAEDPSYYVKSGGGTSSATPQVAAAAALYIQKHKKYLSQFKGKDAWKKAEIVRQALFASADSTTQYNFVYGRGLLRAHEALNKKYEPAQFVNKISPAKEAPEKRRFLGGLFGVYFNRSITSKSNPELEEKLQDMMVTEICQLMHKDPELFTYLDEVKIDENEMSLESPGLVEKIMQSAYASDFLKQQLSVLQKENSPTLSNNPEFNSRHIEGKRGRINIRSRGVNFNVNNSKSYREYYDGVAVWVDEFELELSASRSLRAGAEREFQIEVNDEGTQSVMLVEKVYEDGTIVEWKSDMLDALQDKNARSASTDAFAVNRFSFSQRELQSGERGVFDKIKKVGVKVFKWITGKKEDLQPQVLSKLVGPLGDNNYEILVFDLQAPENNWRSIEALGATTIYKAIEAEKTKTLLLVLPGLFSTVQKGFDEFLESDKVREDLKVSHCRYVLGLNIPTVVHGIEENAEHLEKLLKNKFSKPKACNVLARSRGGVVARFLFEVTWANSDKNPFILKNLIMFGTPNQGTMIASSQNWKSLFNYATNIARLTLGTVAPVVPTVLTVIKAVGLGFVDLPGINDMEETSKVLTRLNGIKTNRDNYFVFTSNYEPNHNLLRRMLDELIVDKAIFKKQQNDSITPVNGAVFKNEEIPGNLVVLKPEQYNISDRSKQVSHFTYLHAQHPEIIELLFKKI